MKLLEFGYAWAYNTALLLLKLYYFKMVYNSKSYWIRVCIEYFITYLSETVVCAQEVDLYVIFIFVNIPKSKHESSLRLVNELILKLD